MTSRRLFTILLFAPIGELLAASDTATDRAIDEITRLSREYVKIQDAAAKRARYVNPVNDAAIIGLYDKLATCHDCLAAAFRALAESYRR